MGFEFSRTRPRHFQTFPLGQFSTMSAWAKLKVAELKDELKQRGLAVVAGKKAELVARLEEYESEMRQATEPEPPSKKQKKASPEPSKPSKQAPVPPATKPEGLVDDAAELAEVERLRGCGAVHLAAAMEISADVVTSADNDLLRAAARVGLHTADPTAG